MATPERLGRILLILFGIGFMALGSRYFADPHALTAETDVGVPTGKAVMEVRTVYGGMFFGLGLAVLVMGLKRSLLAAGLWVLILVAGSVAAARMLAIALGQAPDPMFATLLGIEIIGVALAAFALRRLDP
jgi:hypothetical protein